MLPEPQGEAVADGGQERAEDLALHLLGLAGDESVRVVEALAAALANGGRHRPGAALDAVVRTSPGLCEDSTSIDDLGRRLGLCRRVARRALRGSLADPTRGANAFHRIDEGPGWARDLLPVAMFGPFLFYRR
jgi:hypothetical protein